MARLILAVTLIILVSVVVGCVGPDSGKGQLISVRARQTTAVTPVDMSKAGESDLVEQVAVHRQGYRHSLETLADFYRRTGNNMKLAWAEKELSACDTTPQYNYIIEAGVAGPKLQAKTLIAEADDLYREAVEIEGRARQLLVVKDENLLRLALDKYNQLIRMYPSSDKVDDAAYNAAGIYEHFKDYTIALLYYQRAYQWDEQTPYPARFRAALILDKHLHRRAEALELYREAVEKESSHTQWVSYAQNRIKAITKSEEKVKEATK